MNIFMGLDDTMRPNGWDVNPWGNAIEVDESIFNLSKLHPDWVWDGEILVPLIIAAPLEPPVIVPQIVKMRQCRLYLDGMDPINGKNVLDIIEFDIIPTLSRRAQIEWHSSDEVWRSSPMVEQMRLLFGWTIEQMDQMFVDAYLL